ncbi:MAG: hypothetical protein IPJ23_00175 [Ignavibacteriales bacterium]|nr:hypothetical protein [Ignavibacteriales bacterium]
MRIISLLLLFFSTSFAQTISTSRIETIIKLLIKNSIEISNYIYPAELQISNRFGIEYDGIKINF